MTYAIPPLLVSISILAATSYLPFEAQAAGPKGSFQELEAKARERQEAAYRDLEAWFRSNGMAPAFAGRTAAYWSNFYVQQYLGMLSMGVEDKMADTYARYATVYQIGIQLNLATQKAPRGWQPNRREWTEDDKARFEARTGVSLPF